MVANLERLMMDLYDDFDAPSTSDDFHFYNEKGFFDEGWDAEPYEAHWLNSSDNDMADDENDCYF
ncbi:MAG TPA: hypothetical protein VIY48_12985 [Candidatus Paceibacterota bacterium]